MRRTRNSWLPQYVTYHRDVAAERKAIKAKEAAFEKRIQREIRLQAKKEHARELAQVRKLELAERRRKAERKRADEVDRRIEKLDREKRWTRQLKRNGKWSKVKAIRITNSGVVQIRR